MRRTLHKIARLGDLEASGNTLAEAKAILHDWVEKAVTGSYAPKLLMGAGYQTLVYRTPHGWLYTAPSVVGKPLNRCAISCDNAEDAQAKAEVHIAQCAFRIDGDDHEIAEMISNEKERTRFLDWCRWQRSYSQLRAEGHDDLYCFEHARAS